MTPWVPLYALGLRPSGLPMEPPESSTHPQGTQPQVVPREPPIHPQGACVPQYSHNISIYPQDNPYPPIQPQLPPIQLHPQNALYVFYASPGNPCAPLEPQHAP